jgi:hypothetical protein
MSRRLASELIFLLLLVHHKLYLSGQHGRLGWVSGLISSRRMRRPRSYADDRYYF